MNEELITLQIEELNNDVVSAEEVATVEYIEIEDVEATEIEVDETTGWVGGEPTNHYSLYGRDEPNQHKIKAITGLKDMLENLGSPRNIYTTSSGFAEFQQWKSDGYYKTEENYIKTNGVGLFVSLMPETGSLNGGNLRIDICKKIHNDNTVEVIDVYGVTVDKSGICGNQIEEYNLFPPNSLDVENNESSVLNRENDYNYAKVCLLGNVKVRVSDTEYVDIDVGDYVVPNEVGYAQKSKNNIGFKVISKGQIESTGNTTTSWNYVTIALVPQNDNAIRIMAEIEEVKNSLKNANSQFGAMSDAVNGIYDTTVRVEDFEKNNASIKEQFQVVQDVADKAKEVADQAEQKMENASIKYNEAIGKAEKAEETAAGVLGTVSKLMDDLQPLAQWDEEGNSKVVNFVAQANENSVDLATLTQAFGKDASYLTAIIQKIDENGAAIQHLVTHVDKYILGSQPPTKDLTLEQAFFIQEGTIYVPTEDSEVEYTYTDEETGETETIPWKFISQVKDDQGNSLGYGMSYIWQEVENKNYCMWQEYKQVSLSTEKIIDTSEGDLWYCWRGVLENGDTYLYNPGTLYCWMETNFKEIDAETGVTSKRYIWVPVASVEDGNAASVGSVNQTAKNFQVVYKNLKGDIATLRVDVDKISSTVKSEVVDQISSIDQTAKEIMMGIYDTKDGSSTSLGLLLNGMRSTSIDTSTVKILDVPEAPPDGDKYENAPSWNGTEFVFSGTPSDQGKYYFDPNDTKPYTYYCEAAGNRYYVWGINNVAMANISTRVTNTESEVESWTRFQKGQNETMTSINQASDAAGAAISSMVYGDFRECVEITEEDKNDFATNLYEKQPSWNLTDKKFESDEKPITRNLIDGDIVYCLSESNTKVYYKLFYHKNDDGVIEITDFEKYQMKSSPYASIVQKIEDGKSTIGLVSGNDESMGSVVVNTINDKSEVLIDADKIGINGTAIFRDNLRTGTTTISGDYIRTGVLTSANYNGPVTYKKFGAKIIDNKIAVGALSDCLWYAPVVRGQKYELLPVDDHTYYVGNKIEVDEEVEVLTKTELSPSKVAGYIISDKDFDLVQTNASVVGTKFDLNAGTIFSRNFSLDREGDLTIAGRITATSGYIGNGLDGFIISNEMASEEYRYVVDKDELEAGNYDFKIGHTYYSFPLEFSLFRNDIIELDLTNGRVKIWYMDSSTLPELKTVKYTASSVHSDDTTTLYSTASNACYYLGNDQFSLKGNESGENGVYISPIGIGLGNGNFYVDNLGNLNTFGNVTMYNKVQNEDGTFTNTPVVKLDKENGSLTLSGNITLGGNITWDMSNSPVKSQYSSNYTDDEDDTNDSWHETFTEGDKFMQMSFDGGKTWNAPTKIVGEDGKNGSNGSDADVTPENVFNALTDNGAVKGIFGTKANNEMSLYINANYINAGKIKAKHIQVNDEDVVTASDNNLYIKRIFGDSNTEVTANGRTYPGMYYLEIQSGFAPWDEEQNNSVGADLCVKKLEFPDGILDDKESLVYGFIFDQASNDSSYSVNFMVGASNGFSDNLDVPNRHSIWGYNYTQGVTYFKGAWKASDNTTFDFTDAKSVTGLDVIAVFG